MEREALEQAIVAALAGRADVELALLFGSRARDRAREDSDVDLAVLLAPDVDRLALREALVDALGLEVDLVDLRRASVPLLDAILTDGRRVHEGRRGAYGDWLGRVVMQQETDRPQWARTRDAWLERLARGGA